MKISRPPQKIWKIVLATIVAITSTQISSPALAADIPFTYSGYVYTSGGYSVGDTMTSSYTSWSPSATSYSYQWYRGTTLIPGETGSTYQVQGEDYATYIYVKITAFRTGYLPSTVSSSGSYVYSKGNFLSSLKPQISGEPQVGEILSALTPGWPSGTSFTYQWYASGYSIYGATGSTYQLKSSEKNDTISVSVTASKSGYNTTTRSSVSTTYVKPSLPKVTWTQTQGVLTGKNILTAKAAKAYDSYENIARWCFTLDGAPLNLPASTKGAYFYDAAGYKVGSFKYSSNCFQYTVDSTMYDARLRVDVTGWSVGTHTLTATAMDAAGYTSASASMTVVVAKTAPTVAITNPVMPLANTFTLAGTTTTHSPTAPIRGWCLTIDGSPVKSVVSSAFKNSQGASQALNPKSMKLGAGCLEGSASDLSTAELQLNSMLYTNGNHNLSLKVISGDGETTWWSDTVTVPITIKNKFIPEVSWASSVTQPTMKSLATKISGKITANIPGNPSSIVLSSVDESGVATPISTFTSTRDFNLSQKFAGSAKIKIDIYDEDKILALSETREIKISPFVKVGKPRISITGSTISDKTTKTVTLPVKSASGQSPTCKAKWSGGSRTFKVSGAKTTNLTFTPSGKGTVTVVCEADGLVDSKAISARY